MAVCCDSLLFMVVWLVAVGSTIPIPDRTTAISGNYPTADQLMLNYRQRNGFLGSAVSILQDSDLIYASGYGSFLGRPVSASSVLPIHKLSKVLTSIATLQLIQENLMTSSDTLFGPTGLLFNYKPSNGQPISVSMQAITVEHLLQEEAGWDETFDHRNNPKVNPDVHRNPPGGVDADTVSPDWVDPKEAIQDKLGKPLDFEPGRRTAPCNICFNILGRVIEQITGESYETYVHYHILEPAGMYNTHLGPNAEVISDMKSNSNWTRSEHPVDSIDHMIARAYQHEASEGWYSTLYDISRLFICLFDSTKCDHELLTEQTLSDALGNKRKSIKHGRQWSSLGMTVKSDGTIMAECSDWSTKYSVFVLRKPIQNDLEQVITQTIIFMGQSSRHRKHMNGLELFPLVTGQSNAFVDEVRANMVNPQSQQVLFYSTIKPDHLVSKSNALRIIGYHPTWFHAYKHQGKTQILVRYQVVTSPEQHKFRLAVGTSKMVILQSIAASATSDYQITMLQSLDCNADQTHGDENILHIVKMDILQELNPILFDIDTTMEAYITDTAQAYAEGFYPVVLNIRAAKSAKRVSYILEKNEPKLESTASQDLTLQEFIGTTKFMLSNGYTLEYMCSVFANGNSTFSAIYRKIDNIPEWVLVVDIQPNELQGQLKQWNQMGYNLHFMIGNQQGDDVTFIGFWMFRA